jgi:hypothetical protein
MVIQIHQLLFDGRVPEVNDKCLLSWEELRSPFEIRAWRNDDIRNFVTHAHPLVRNLMRRARNFGEASDILRIAIINEFGGIYTDWDIYLLSPQGFVDRFTMVAENEALFLRDSKNADPGFNAIVTHSFFYSEPKNSLLQAFLERISENYKNNPSEITIHVTGPHAFTRFLLDKGWSLDADPFVEFGLFFRHDYEIASAQSDRARFLENEICTPGAAPLLNLWTNCWVKKPSKKTIFKTFPVLGLWRRDPFKASMEYILSK